MNAKKYFEEFGEYIESLNEKEFVDLLTESGFTTKNEYKDLEFGSVMAKTKYRMVTPLFSDKHTYFSSVTLNNLSEIDKVA